MRRMSTDPNLLFICSRNQWRSPTAEKVYRSKGYKSRSAGTSAKASKTVSENDIRWSSHIFVMEKKHKQRFLAKLPRLLEGKKTIVLDIADNYHYLNQ